MPTKPPPPARARQPRRRRAGPLTLAIDIGGTGLKAVVLDARGRPMGDRVRVPTPADRPPSTVVRAIHDMVASVGAYDRISVGFPGVVRDGVVRTAPNFGSPAWRGLNLARALEKALERPVRVVNDAEVQGLAVISGQGFELVITLGTGVGSALFQDGALLPHLELSQDPVRGRKTYDQYLGDRARKRLGTGKWNRRVRRVLGILETVFNFDRLYLGGGNAARIDFPLGRRVRIVDNAAGLLGGIALWKSAARLCLLCACLAAAQPAGAQTAPEAEADQIHQPGLFDDLGHDVKRLSSKSSQTWLGAGLATMLLSLAADDYLTAHFTGGRDTEEAFEPGEVLGSVAVQAGGATAVYLLGKALHKPAVTAVGAHLVRAQFLTQAVTQGIKYGVQRTRPNGTTLSFPSGHASTTFATATVLQRHFGWKVGVPAYGAAAYVAASRIQSRKHYLSDVVVGATIGIIAGRAVTVGRGRATFAPVPVLTSGGAGINFVRVGSGR